MKRIFLCILVGFAASSGNALAQYMPFWGAKAPLPFETPADSLKKGQFTWAPTAAPRGPIIVIVSLDEQRAYTYRNGILIGVATVSTGKAGHRTPTGIFTTKMKDVDHHSSIYDNAAMPYTQRLTDYGIALHAGGIPGYPSSHGCIHLPSEYARLLFQASPLGMTVVIADAKKPFGIVNHPAFLAPVNAAGKEQRNTSLTPVEKYRWQPERSPAGPLSIIISRTDQRMVIMRNGIEIGRSRIAIRNPNDSIGTHILVAHDADSSSALQAVTNSTVRKWVAIHFLDTEYEADHFSDPLSDQRITVPRGFLHEILPAITDGTTIVLTDARILKHTTGAGLALLTSSPNAR